MKDTCDTLCLTYRLFRDEDLPGLLRLWEENSGWGSITAEQWFDWYVTTPGGPSTVAVAVDPEGEIVGQEIFTPSHLWINGREVMALRLSAPILRKDLRLKSLRKVDHPVVGLFSVGRDAAVSNQVGLIYAMPDHAWVPFFRWAPRMGLPRFSDREFGCVSVPLSPPSMPFSFTSLAVGPVEAFGEEFSTLWEETASGLKNTCAVVRSIPWLSYKNGNHLCLASHTAEGRLAGYIAIHRKSRLIVDALARTPEDMTAVFLNSVDWLAAKRSAIGETADLELKAMETDLLRPALTLIEAKPVDFKFALVCHTLDPSLPDGDDLLPCWNAMPGD